MAGLFGFVGRKVAVDQVEDLTVFPVGCVQQVTFYVLYLSVEGAFLMNSHDSVLAGRWSLIGHDFVVLVVSIIFLPIQHVLFNSGFGEQGYVGCSLTDLVIDDVSLLFIDLVDVEGDDGQLEVFLFRLHWLVTFLVGQKLVEVGGEWLDGCIVFLSLFGSGFFIQPFLELQLLRVVLLEETFRWAFVLLVLFLVVVLDTPERSIVEFADLARIRVRGD